MSRRSNTSQPSTAHESPPRRRLHSRGLFAAASCSIHPPCSMYLHVPTYTQSRLESAWCSQRLQTLLGLVQRTTTGRLPRTRRRALLWLHSDDDHLSAAVSRRHDQSICSAAACLSLLRSVKSRSIACIRLPCRERWAVCPAVASCLSSLPIRGISRAFGQTAHATSQPITTASLPIDNLCRKLITTHRRDPRSGFAGHHARRPRHVSGLSSNSASMRIHYAVCGRLTTDQCHRQCRRRRETRRRCCSLLQRCQWVGVAPFHG